jgi:hypothetical protein
MAQATLQQPHQQLDQSKHRIDKNDVNLLNFILRRSGGGEMKKRRRGYRSLSKTSR